MQLAQLFFCHIGNSSNSLYDKKYAHAHKWDVSLRDCARRGKVPGIPYLEKTPKVSNEKTDK